MDLIEGCWAPLFRFLRKHATRVCSNKVACSSRSQVRESLSNKFPIAGGQKATGVRVGLEALLQPEAAHAANNKDSEPHARPKNGSGKCKYRSALALASKQGYALYKGQTLRFKCDFVPTSVRTHRAGRRVERLGCLSWNSGGMSTELNAEFFKFLEVAGDVGFFSVQETHWGLNSDWTTPSWHMVHTSTGHFRSGGILFGMHSKYVNKESIKWRVLVEGRLLHVRFVFQRQQFDVISIYQHAMTFSDGEVRKETMQKRKKLWRALDKLLAELPLRSSIVLMGDFNTSLSPMPKVVGYGVKLGSKGSEILEDRGILLELLGRAGLCVLNSWGPIQTTYEHPKGSSQIDFICVRQAVADGKSKQSGPRPAPIAAWRSSGHKVVVADIPVNWKPWAQKPCYRPQRQLQPHVPHPMEVATEPNPTLSRITLSLCKHCPRRESRVSKPELRDLGVEIQHLWSQRKGAVKTSALCVSVADCFGALKQNVGVMKAHRALRKAARDRKRDQILSLLQGAEDAAKAKDSRRLFQYVRLLSRKISSKKIHLRGAKGELLEPSQECTLLASYARELFKGNKFASFELAPLPEEWFSPDAWVRAFAKLKSHKAVPYDSATVESWKENAVVLAPALSEIARDHLRCSEVRIPSKWHSAQLVWIAKPSRLRQRQKIYAHSALWPRTVRLFFTF